MFAHSTRHPNCGRKRADVLKEVGLMPPLSAEERTILARFTFRERAEAAREALHRAGLDVVSVGALHEGARNAFEPPLVEWGRYGYEPRNLDDKWTSASSWDNALGLNLGESVLLTAVVPEEAAGRAADIIREHGGLI
jgi:hypothetical protein